MKAMAKIACATGLAIALFASGAIWKLSARRATAADRCLVTSTAGHPVPGRPSFNVGNARIAVALPKGSRFLAVPDRSPVGGQAFIQQNGWIRTKLGWFAKRGTPRVSGRRVDGTGPRLRADVGPLSYVGAGAFYPSLLYFSSVGCWRITATAGAASLHAVVLVTR